MEQVFKILFTELIATLVRLLDLTLDFGEAIFAIINKTDIERKIGLVFSTHFEIGRLKFAE
jgi:hypothetical protein